MRDISTRVSVQAEVQAEVQVAPLPYSSHRFAWHHESFPSSYQAWGVNHDARVARGLLLPSR